MNKTPRQPTSKRAAVAALVALVAALLLLLSGALTACYRLDLTGDGEFLCSDNICPDGFVCRTVEGDKVCVRGTGSSAPAADSSSNWDAGTAD